MFDFAAKLLMAKALRMERGEIKIFNIPVVMGPADYVVCLMHRLVEEFGFEKAHDIIYSEAKKGTQEYSKELERNTTSRGSELAKLYSDIITLAGYGTAKITTFDQINKRVICRFDNSPVVERFVKLYGKSKYPVDTVTNGFYAGSFNVLFNQNNESIEVKCAAMGDAYCEFVYDSPENINRIKDKLWPNFSSGSKLKC